jgi:hypothetical protein
MANRGFGTLQAQDEDLDLAVALIACGCQTKDGAQHQTPYRGVRRASQHPREPLVRWLIEFWYPWGANTRSRGNLVLVNEPTEEIAPLDVRHDANLRDRRSSLGSQELKPSMRPLPVVVLHVGPQNPVQVPGAEDQLPVQTVGAQRLHPAL